MFRRWFFTMKRGKRYVSSSKPARSRIKDTVNAALGKYLLVTNTVSSGGLLFLGDLFQQELEYQQKKIPKRYDYGRLIKMLLTGLGMGPVHHYYYTTLNKFLPKRNIQTVVQKIALDQVVMSPVCILQFFYSIGLMEMKTVQECTKEIVDKFVEVYTVDWCIWPPTQFVNFYVVPAKFQVLYINCATMMYDVFLSYIKHRKNQLEIQA